MFDSKFPKVLYKYISWHSEYNRRILTQNSIYFCSPYKFNDPFDCSINVRYEEITDEEALEHIKIMITKDFPHLKADEVEKYARLEQKEKSYKDPETIARTRRVQSEATNEAFGIFALSEIRDNILMWSHYSAAHKGLCIGFDCYKLNKFLTDYLGTGSIACFKVDYDLKYPSIFFNEPHDSFFKKLFLVKASAWEYEKEWRFILFRRTNKEIQIPEEIISEVIFGCRIPREHRIEVIEILRDRKSEVKVFQAEPSSTKFQLDLRGIDYLWSKQD